MMTEPTLAYYLIDILWPDHDRTSCNDESLNNSYCNDQGFPRCHRCYALENRGQPLSVFVIESSIREKVDPEVLRQKALKKLTAEDRRILGL